MPRKGKDLEERFQAAVSTIRGLPAEGPFQPTQEMQLRFYSLFKQATVGPCTVPQPWGWQVVERAKWNAWNSLGADMSQDEAKEEYINFLLEVAETFPASKTKDGIVAAVSGSGLPKPQPLEDLQGIVSGNTSMSEDEDEDDSTMLGQADITLGPMSSGSSLAGLDTSGEVDTSQELTFGSEGGNTPGGTDGEQSNSFLALEQLEQSITSPGSVHSATPNSGTRHLIEETPPFSPISSSASRPVTQSAQQRSVGWAHRRQGGQHMTDDELRESLTRDIERMKTALNRDASRFDKLEQQMQELIQGSSRIRQQMRQVSAGYDKTESLRDDLHSLLLQVELALDRSQNARNSAHDEALERIEALEQRLIGKSNEAVGGTDSSAVSWAGIVANVALAAIPVVAVAGYWINQRRRRRLA